MRASFVIYRVSLSIHSLRFHKVVGSTSGTKLSTISNKDYSTTLSTKTSLQFFKDDSQAKVACFS